jgi:hypothetical protein
MRENVWTMKGVNVMKLPAVEEGYIYKVKFMSLRQIERKYWYLYRDRNDGMLM